MKRCVVLDRAELAGWIESAKTPKKAAIGIGNSKEEAVGVKNGNKFPILPRFSKPQTSKSNILPTCAQLSTLRNKYQPPSPSPHLQTPPTLKRRPAHPSISKTSTLHLPLYLHNPVISQIQIPLDIIRNEPIQRSVRIDARTFGMHGIICKT